MGYVVAWEVKLEEVKNMTEAGEQENQIRLLVWE